MYRFFKFERNELCPCGSGKKYKKCCLSTVSEAISHFDDSWKRVFSGLAEAMGMVCGLDAAEEETIPEPDRVNKIVKQATAILENEDENEAAYELTRRLNTLAKFFREEKMLIGNLFPYEQVEDLMIKIETSLPGEEENPDFESIIEDLSEEYLPQVVDKQKAEDMAWCFLDLLRSREWDDWSLECLSTGLMLSLEENVLANPLWDLVLHVSLEKNAKAMAEMEELRAKFKNKEEDAAQLLEDYIKDNPIMHGYWSRKIWADAAQALTAIETGELPVKMPLHSVLGSFVCTVDFAGKLKEKELKKDSLDNIIDKLLNQKNEYSIELLKLLIKKGIILDLDIFLKHMNEFLDRWIKEGEGTEDLKTSAATLLININMGVLPAQLHMLENIYIKTFLNATKNIPVTLPAFEDTPALTLDWEKLNSRDGMEKYAAYLDKAGEKEAGSHVRKVIDEVIAGD